MRLAPDCVAGFSTSSNLTLNAIDGVGISAMYAQARLETRPGLPVLSAPDEATTRWLGSFAATCGGPHCGKRGCHELDPSLGDFSSLSGILASRASCRLLSAHYAIYTVFWMHRNIIAWGK